MGTLNNHRPTFQSSTHDTTTDSIDTSNFAFHLVSDSGDYNRSLNHKAQRVTKAETKDGWLPGIRNVPISTVACHITGYLEL